MSRRCVECSLPKERHGADGKCPGGTTKYGTMDLPPGMTCADCAHFEGFCSKFIGPDIATNTTCDWYPIRFYPKAALYVKRSQPSTPDAGPHADPQGERDGE
jgi:hypothetical protein